ISPVIQVLIFGYAATTDIDTVPFGIYDLDNTKDSRDLVREFTYSKYFVPKYYISNDEQQRKLIDKSSINTILRMNRQFGDDLNAKKGAEVQLILDGTDSNTAQVVLGYSTSIINRYEYKMLRSEYGFSENSQGIPYIDLRDRAWFNENLISRNFNLPGVIAMIVTIMSLLLSAMAIVREKEIGTMEQLIVSPIKPIELILGKLSPFAVIALAQVIMITLVGVLWFHVPIRGSLVLLLCATMVYLLTSLGIGLYISTLCATQQEAMMSVFLFYFPTVLLSGFAYPVANMPQVIQWLTVINPLKYYLVVVRGIFLKGVGINVLWYQILPLFVIGVTVLVLSSLRFRSRLG
ncbi:MAG: ABC transporter permease, partial [Candidatus Omnitrophica bacterium]|nr:ABC transporter permease [Candidatus Omnitrophota bacterium]